jgi:predicted dehydrogenase
MIRVGITGLGVIGTYYRKAVADHPGTSLVAVCDLRPELLGDAPARYTDHRRMLAEADLDAVVVTVPNDTHHAVCRDALDAGVAVCVEKPLATTLADARDLDRRGRAPLFTAFHRRYNDNYRALRSTLATDGATPVHVVVRYLERIEDHVGVDAWYLEPDRCGGGCVADNGRPRPRAARRRVGHRRRDHQGGRRGPAGRDRAARPDRCHRAGRAGLVLSR